MEVASATNPAFNQSIDTMTQTLNIDRDSTYALFNATVDGQAAIMGLNDVFLSSHPSRDLYRDHSADLDHEAGAH